ncbi:MAG: DUF2768 family protein [Candidatus Pristimantibacillus sp.]
MDPMTKMWVSLVGIGLMAIAAVIVSFARLKTKGVLKFILSLVAFVLLVIGFIYGIFAII